MKNRTRVPKTIKESWIWEGLLAWNYLSKRWEGWSCKLLQYFNRRKNVCYWIYMIQILGLLKYKLLSYYCQSLVHWWLLKSWKYLNTRYLSITAELMEANFIIYLLRPVNLFSMFLLRNHCFTSGRNQSLYPLIRRTIKTDRSNYRCETFKSTTCKYLSSIFFLTFDTSRRRNCWTWSVWVWTWLIKTNHIYCFQVLGKNRKTMKKWINYLQTSRKPMILLQGRFPTILFSLVHSQNYLG
jgi:hypothetical protein